jgi:hypothetical protein
MSMLLFMPWCPIDRVYDSDCIRILPYRRGHPLEGLDQPQQSQVDAMMGMYKTIEGKPIHSAAILCFAGKAPIDELSEPEKEQAFDFADLACFSGLARREFFASAGSYCNRDCFMLYGQGFGPTDFGVLTWRQRQGRSGSTWRMNRITFSVPLHCYTVHEVTIDANLLEALAKCRAQSPANEWDRWRNSILYFNQANTDSDNISLQVESVLMVGAFQHLLNAQKKPYDKDVARRFSEIVTPHTSLLTRTSQRGSTRWPSSQEPLRYEWMREFYQIRNDFAHGKLRTGQPTVWTPGEHIVLSAIAFPLLVKCLLKEAGGYGLTDIDRREIDCFEKLADTNDFLELPADSQDSADTHWTRCWWGWIKQEARRLDAEAISAEEARRAQRNDSPQEASDAADEE